MFNCVLIYVAKLKVAMVQRFSPRKESTGENNEPFSIRDEKGYKADHLRFRSFRTIHRTEQSNPGRLAYAFRGMRS
jgi:hypothetical protein